MRIVSWNIRAGGGRRAAAIAGQVHDWGADIALLGEFRGTAPSAAIAAELAADGLTHQLSLADPGSPARNALLLASRFPLRATRSRRAPAEPGRWLLSEVMAPRPFFLAGTHFPNEVTGRKFPYMEAVVSVAEAWRRGPAVVLGDTNSGRPGIDEENAVFRPYYGRWFDRMEAAGFYDAFRRLHGERREYTWYSPNGGNGFRIDQAFVNRPLLPRLRGLRHEWAAREGRRDALSDHAALILDLHP